MFRSVSLTRRQVLKLGAAGAGVVAATTLAGQGALAEDLIRGGRAVSRTTGAARRAVPSTCAHCSARCGILGFVEEDRLVKIEGNPRDPNCRGRLCALGHAGINRVYDQDRLLFPMERVGRRGEGQWVRLSWEQAYDELSRRLLDLQTRDPRSLVLHLGAETSSLLATRFLAAFGSRALVDEAWLDGVNRATANRLSLGTESEVVDVARARYILNFGGNPYESHPVYLAFIQRLVDARMSGAKLVTFDPRLSTTAGRSDEWLPVAPGSDALVALAMANVIVQQGLHDRQFLAQWSDLPVDQLAAQLAPYTPEMAESASGIRADDLRRLAIEFARVRPAVAIFGGGVSRQTGAVDTQRAVILLNAVVGSVGTPGGYCPAPRIALPEPDPAPPSVPDRSEGVRVVEELVQGRGAVGMYVSCLANPAYSWPHAEAFRQALQDERRVPYLVAIDTNLTETSMLADLVLPAATYLESWGLESPPPQDLVPFVTLRQPVVAPRGEALSLDDILLTLGTRLEEKSASFFPFPTVESYVSSAVSKVQPLAAAGGLPSLREHGVWYDLAATPRYRPRPEAFGTGSGKVELGPQVGGAIRPERTALTVQGGATSRSSELDLVTYRPGLHHGDYTANCWWLAEIAHNNVLLINPVAAEARGIKQGHRVRVTSAVGTAEVRVRITQGIHPGVVALASGFGHEAVGRIARAERFKSGDPMTMEVWWEGHGNGVNASALIPGTADERGGGLVWMDTRVRIEAV